MIELDLQNTLGDLESLPTGEQFNRWVAEVLAGRRDEAQLTIRLVDETEMAELNQSYRNKPGTTNVLSFPFEAPSGVELPLLGDIVICGAVVAREAGEQGKALEAHWAHMVVHGCLHLLGYDHIEEEEAEEMEGLERELLAQFGYTDPYASDQ